MALNLPAQLAIDRGVGYEPYLLRIEVYEHVTKETKKGKGRVVRTTVQVAFQPPDTGVTQRPDDVPGKAKLVEILYEEPGGTFGHRPGDPSPWLRPGTRGWSCPPGGAWRACVWLGAL
jgi:hypothetical protein